MTRSTRARAAPLGRDGFMVEARGLRKIYETGRLRVEALRDVDFAVRPGEMVAVMGPSGCGKTTLLNCLSGLDDVDEGTVRIEGRDLTRMSDSEKTRYRSERMGFVFQSFNLLPVLTAVENVELPLIVRGGKRKQTRARAAQALDRVGLSERLDHFPKELSGGEQQRVAIARSIVNEPAIVWADEPTGNIDSETSRQILDLIRELNGHLKQSYVIVTHSPEVAGSCDRIVRMRNGTIEPRATTRNG